MTDIRQPDQISDIFRCIKARNRGVEPLPLIYFPSMLPGKSPPAFSLDQLNQFFDSPPYPEVFAGMSPRGVVVRLLRRRNTPSSGV